MVHDKLNNHHRTQLCQKDNIRLRAELDNSLRVQKIFEEKLLEKVGRIDLLEVKQSFEGFLYVARLLEMSLLQKQFKQLEKDKNALIEQLTAMQECGERHREEIEDLDKLLLKGDNTIHLLQADNAKLKMLVTQSRESER